MSLRSTIVPLLVLGLLVGGCDRQVSSPEQANATPESAANVTAAANLAAPDTIGTLDRSHKGEAAPAVPFQDPSGKTVSIATFAGKPVLLNLWATWCAPCVKEMPTLDKVAETFTVVPVSQDFDGAAKVTPFFAKGGYKHLKPYLDTKTGLSIAYNASLPTSVLYDSTGHEVWRMAGGMDWTSKTAKELLGEAH